MAVTVADVMRHCRNYFEIGYVEGTFRITGNALPESEGVHYVYISGSLYHSGVHEVSDGFITDISDDVHDEEFDGRVWLLAPPVDFLRMCEEIADFENHRPAGGLTHEEFGGYSRSWDATETGKDWTHTFRSALVPYVKMFTEVR